MFAPLLMFVSLNDSLNKIKFKFIKSQITNLILIYSRFIIKILENQ